MSLLLLMGSALGFLLETKVGQIASPLSTDTWERYAIKPSGSGADSDPWIINTAEELAYLINNINDGIYCIELHSDIDLGAHEWEPIKSKDKNAKVWFSGYNHTIKNLNINRPWEDSCGLFSKFSPNYEAWLNISDTIFSNVDIRGNSVGVVCGYSCAGTITNCHITSGNIVGDANAGAFSSMFWGKVSYCTNNAAVFSRTDAAGGIVSYCSEIVYCVNSGNVTGGGDYRDSDSTIGTVGGIAANCALIENCINTGTVTSFGNAYVGGITGAGAIKNSGFYGDINLRTKPKLVGTIAGEANGNCENCFGVATINYEPDVQADLSTINTYGLPKDNKIVNCYSYSKVFTSDKKTLEYRKYCGSDFSGFVYHENINGGYPFPKTLFAVGQFLSGNTLSYLKAYGFTA